MRVFGGSLGWPFERTITFGSRSYRIDRKVFDPQRHLSGVAFASSVPDLVRPGMRVLDLGTGCGLLAGVAAQCGAIVVATDITRAAVACASHNLADLGVDVRLGDLFEPVIGERFDLALCNPPYEAGGSTDITLASPQFLQRFGALAPGFADRIALGFPANDVSTLHESGIAYALWRRIETTGDALGIFLGPDRYQSVG